MSEAPVRVTPTAVRVSEKSPRSTPATPSLKVTAIAVTAVVRGLGEIAVIAAVGTTESKTMLALPAALGLAGEMPVAAPAATLTCTVPCPVGVTVAS